jgi:hypothetical protein
MTKKPYQLCVMFTASMLSLTSVVEALVDMNVDFKVTNYLRPDRKKVASVTVFCENDVKFQKIQKEFSMI